MNLLLATLKVVAEYYPGRLYKAFVIDPPSLFSYLWKVKFNFKKLKPTPINFLFSVFNHAKHCDIFVTFGYYISFSYVNSHYYVSFIKRLLVIFFRFSWVVLELFGNYFVYGYMMCCFAGC